MAFKDIKDTILAKFASKAAFTSMAVRKTEEQDALGMEAFVPLELRERMKEAAAEVAGTVQASAPTVRPS